MVHITFSVCYKQKKILLASNFVFQYKFEKPEKNSEFNICITTTRSFQTKFHRFKLVNVQEIGRVIQFTTWVHRPNSLLTGERSL